MSVMLAFTFVAQGFSSYIVFLQKKSPLITWLFPKMQSLPQSLLFWNLLSWIFHKVKSDLGASYANKIGIWSSFIWCIMRKPLFTIYSYLLKNHPHIIKPSEMPGISFQIGLFMVKKVLQVDLLASTLGCLEMKYILPFGMDGTNVNMIFFICLAVIVVVCL